MTEPACYRLYLFDGAKRISRHEIIDAQNDAAAIARAQTVRQNFGGELWDGPRLVAAIEATLIGAIGDRLAQ